MGGANARLTVARRSARWHGYAKEWICGGLLLAPAMRFINAEKPPLLAKNARNGAPGDSTQTPHLKNCCKRPSRVVFLWSTSETDVRHAKCS